MDPSNDKKRKERFFLDRFLECRKIVPTLVEERESPDFLLHLNDKTVGVEVTFLHIRDSSPEPLIQEVESVTDGITSDAEDLYHASDGIPVHVTVLFGFNFRPKAVRWKGVSRGLVDIVRGMGLNPGESGEWRSWDEENWDHPLAGSIDRLYAWAVPDPEMARWRVARAGWVAPLTPEHLQRPIAKKSSKIGAYKDAAPENWLLIVANGMKPSQSFDVPRDFPANEVSSPFERTFFYRYPDGEVIEIGPRT